MIHSEKSQNFSVPKWVMALVRRAAIAWLFSLSLNVLAAVPGLDSEIARARQTLDTIQKLTPDSIDKLTREDATNLSLAWMDVSIALPHSAAAAGRVDSPEKYKQFLQAHGLDALVSEKTTSQASMVMSRGDPVEIERYDTDLQSRYPAYGNYVKRARIRTILGLMRKPVGLVEEARGRKQPIDQLGDGELAEINAAPGVRSASYRDGVFRILLNDRIVEGGALDLIISRLPDGKINWRCSSSASIRQFVPEFCRK